MAFLFIFKIRKLDQTGEGVTGRKSGKSGKSGINSRTAVVVFLGQVVDGARSRTANIRIGRQKEVKQGGTKFGDDV